MPETTQRITRSYLPTGAIGRRLTDAHGLQLQSHHITAKLSTHRHWLCQHMQRRGLDRIEHGDLVVTRKLRHHWTYTPETEALMEALRKTQLREQAEGLATDNPTVYVALTTNYKP